MGQSSEETPPPEANTPTADTLTAVTQPPTLTCTLLRYYYATAEFSRTGGFLVAKIFRGGRVAFFLPYYDKGTLF